MNYKLGFPTILALSDSEMEKWFTRMIVDWGICLLLLSWNFWMLEESSSWSLTTVKPNICESSFCCTFYVAVTSTSCYYESTSIGSWNFLPCLFEVFCQMCCDCFCHQVGFIRGGLTAVYICKMFDCNHDLKDNFFLSILYNFIDDFVFCFVLFCQTEW